MDQEIELWAWLDGYESIYKVSNWGRMFSMPRRGTKGGIMIHKPTPAGYMRVKLTKNNIGKSESVHRLVGMAFIPNPNNLPFINHLDANKTNNHFRNLEWCTQDENVQHAKAMGLLVQLKGEEHARANFTNSKVIEIFNDPGTNEELAAKYEVSVACVSKIKTGRTWSTITGKNFNKAPYNYLSKEAKLDIVTSNLARKELAKKYKVTVPAIAKTIEKHRKKPFF